MLLSLGHWIENLTPFAALRAASYAYPIVLGLHLTAISLFAGAILLTDLRLLLTPSRLGESCSWT